MKRFSNLLSHLTPGELLPVFAEEVRVLEELGRWRRFDVVLSDVSQVGLEDLEESSK